MENREKKLEQLKTILRQMGSVLLAYSGGVDSTFLLKFAVEALGDRVLAVTANSETYPRRELEDAKKYALLLKAKHMVIDTKELEIDGFANNPPDRCYYCKHELFSKLLGIAREQNISYVLDGANYDDRNDHRPGMRAGRELGIRSPLKEAGLTKEDIRASSRALKLPTWNKPSFACLSSRFPYGTQITADKLLVVGQAEEYLRSLGFVELRVRHHDSIARIEVGKRDFERLIDYSDEITKYIKSLGFLYVTLDLEGYRTGSMNLTLTRAEIYNDK